MAATSFLTVQARLARALVKLGKYVGQDDGAGARHDPPQDLAGRPCGNGRGGTRKCEPGDKQLEAEQGGFAVVGLLLPGMPRLPHEPRGERRFADPTGYGNKENRPGRAPSADVYADFPHGVARKQQERSFHQSRVFVGVKRVPQPNYG